MPKKCALQGARIDRKSTILTMKINFLGSWCEYGGSEWFLGVYKWGPGGHWSNSGANSDHQELKKLIFMVKNGGGVVGFGRIRMDFDGF